MARALFLMSEHKSVAFRRSRTGTRRASLAGMRTHPTVLALLVLPLALGACAMQTSDEDALDKRGAAEFDTVELLAVGEPIYLELDDAVPTEAYVEKASDGVLRVQSSDLRLLVQPNEVVRITASSGRLDTAMGFRLEYRLAGRDDAEFQEIIPTTELDRGARFIEVMVDQLFGTISGTWKPGEGTEDVHVAGILWDAASPTVARGGFDAPFRPATDGAVEFRITPQPLFAPGELEGLTFDAHVATQSVRDTDIADIELMDDGSGHNVVVAYDSAGEVLAQLSMRTEDLDGDGLSSPGDVITLELRQATEGGEARAHARIEVLEDGSGHLTDHAGSFDEEAARMLKAIGDELTMQGLRSRDDALAVCAGAAIMCGITTAIVAGVVTFFTGIFGPGAGFFVWGACTGAMCGIYVID